MDSNTKKAKPYEYDELMFDGDMDRDRMEATWQRLCEEEMARRSQSYVERAKALNYSWETIRETLRQAEEAVKNGDDYDFEARLKLPQ